MECKTLVCRAKTLNCSAKLCILVQALCTICETLLWCAKLCIDVVQKLCFAVQNFAKTQCTAVENSNQECFVWE